MALVKFVSTNAANFGGLTAKDENTLYFVSDERRIYKGAVPFSGGIYKKVSVLPSTTEAEVNVIYVVGDKGDTAAYYDGTQFVYINKPTSVAADLAALTERVTTAEGKLDTIQGTGEGSISKALSDANAHADTKVQELADGQVATNKSDIAGLKTTVAGKADKATTLAGYGIEDAYNKTEIEAKLKTITDNVNTKVDAATVDSKIATAKEEILKEASTATDLAISTKVGDLGESQTVVEYVQKVVGAGGTDVAEQIETALTTAKSYTDEQLTAAMTIKEF